jgi:membrane associated rhomboid family serine protease
MRTPPPLSSLPRHPVVGGVALLATVVTLGWWAGRLDISPLLPDAHVHRGQLWRFVTDVLPHGNLAHLAFNLYWVWTLGSLVEEVFGHLRALLIVVLFAAVSSAAEYAFLIGGIGLSGVGYGLFGLLWVLSRRDERFGDAVDRQTTVLFVAWFFLCIVLTATNVMPVANIAHGVGALAGVLLGLAVSARGARWAYGALFAVLLGGSVFAATYGRRYLNVSSDRAEEWARLGYEDLLKDRDASAAEHLRKAVRVNGAMPSAWFNLGLASQRLDRFEEARDAYRRASELEPANTEYREAWQEMDGYLQAGKDDGR